MPSPAAPTGHCHGHKREERPEGREPAARERLPGDNEGYAGALWSLLRLSAPARSSGRKAEQGIAAPYLSTTSASQGFARVFPVGLRIRLSLMRLFEDVTAREQHSAGRPGPQPFGGGWVDRQGGRE